MSDLGCLSLTPVYAMQRATASSTLCVDSQGGSQLHVVSCACPVLATPGHTSCTYRQQRLQWLQPCRMLAFLSEEVSVNCQTSLLFS